MVNMQKYSKIFVIFHWVMAFLIIGLLALGFYMTFDENNPNKMYFYNLHKSLGVMVLMLFFGRIINRFFGEKPPLPETINKYEAKLSVIVHFFLYSLMFLMPISGYLMSNSFGYPVNFFGHEMPFLIGKNIELGKVFAKLHWLFAVITISLLVLHIFGVLKHAFFDKKENNVLNRMRF